MKQPQRLGDDFAFAFARAFRSRNCSESRPSENERPPRFLIAGSGKPWHGHEKHCPAAWIEAATKTSARGRNRARDHLQGPGGSGSAPRLPSWSCPSCVCDFRGNVVLCHARRDAGRKRGRWATEAAAGPRCARGPRAGKRPCPNLDSSSKTDLETRGKHRELKRKLSERALTQRKARAREEPSPGPPASETDVRPLGHQPRGGAGLGFRVRVHRI